MTIRKDNSSFTRVEVINNLFNIIKKYYEFLLPIVLGIIYLIPRIPHTRGEDMYNLAFMSVLLLQGHTEWLLTPFSVFGLFPISGYPFGTVLLFALFYILGLGNLDLATFLYTLFILVLSILSTTVLLRQFFDDQRSIFIGNIIFLTVPTFFDFTYFTATARGPFLALAPLVLAWFLKTYKQPSLKMILVALPLPLGLMFFHRMGMVYFIFLVLLLGFILLEQLIKRLQHRSLLQNFTELQKQKTLTLLLLLAMVGTFVFAFFFMGSDYINVLPSSFFPSLPFMEYFIDFINLGFDYFLILGPAVLLFLYGIFLFFSKGLSKENSMIPNFAVKFLFLLFFWPMLIVIKAPPYPRHLIIPLMIPFVIDAWYNLEAKKRAIPLILVILTGCAVYFNAFDLFWRPIFPYNVIFLGVTIGLIIVYVLFKFLNMKRFLNIFPQIDSPEKLHQVISLFFLILVVSLNALTSIEIISVLDIDDTFPPSYTSDEEIQIAAVLRDLVAQNNQPVLFFASHYLIENRIAAYSGCLHLHDRYGISLLIDGTHKYFSVERILTTSTLKPVQDWFQELHIFEYRWANFGLRQWYTIHKEGSRNLLDGLHLKYYVEQKNGNIAVGAWWPPFYSLFMERIDSTTDTIRFETPNLILYELS
ncbi:MAG: hypothetical protein ACFFBD_17995 [Candidatus Hodarchaeota archaeon]